MKQTSSLTRNLAQAQEDHAAQKRIVEPAAPETYRLYVGVQPYAHSTAIEIIKRYFDGATLIPAIGLWRDETEASLVVEIVTDNRQAIFNLAGDFRTVFGQSAVLITWTPVTSFLLTETNIKGE